MNCIIDNSISYHIKKGRKAEVVRRYIKMKYRINIELNALKERMKHLGIQPNNLELT